LPFNSLKAQEYYIFVVYSYFDVHSFTHYIGMSIWLFQELHIWLFLELQKLPVGSGKFKCIKTKQKAIIVKNININNEYFSRCSCGPITHIAIDDKLNKAR